MFITKYLDLECINNRFGWWLSLALYRPYLWRSPVTCIHSSRIKWHTRRQGKWATGEGMGERLSIKVRDVNTCVSIILFSFILRLLFATTIHTKCRMAHNNKCQIVQHTMNAPLNHATHLFTGTCSPLCSSWQFFFCDKLIAFTFAWLLILCVSALHFPRTNANYEWMNKIALKTRNIDEVWLGIKGFIARLPHPFHSNIFNERCWSIFIKKKIPETTTNREKKRRKLIFASTTLHLNQDSLKIQMTRLTKEKCMRIHFWGF